jgi:hypothetical protein
MMRRNGSIRPCVRRASKNGRFGRARTCPRARVGKTSSIRAMTLGVPPDFRPKPDFYPKFGYHEFARLDYPPDHQRIFLKKQLIAE